MADVPVGEIPDPLTLNWRMLMSMNVEGSLGMACRGETNARPSARQAVGPKKVNPAG